MKLDILAFGAHPDDVELSCSGALIKSIQQGKKVGLIDLTRGELGTRGSMEIREAEAAESARILGVSIRENLNLADCFFNNDKESRLAVVKAIRKYQPEIILANAIRDRHPDHGRGAALVSEAVFLAGLLKVETTVDPPNGTDSVFQRNGKKQDLWKTKAVYHYIQDRHIEPDFVIDISDVIEHKTKSIMAFKSQFYNADSKEPETAISSKEFLELLEGKAMAFGRSIGVRYAEAFTVERTPGVKSLFDLV